MTPFDLALSGLVLIGGLWGMLRGAMRQVGSVVAWVACILVPWKVGGPVAHFLEKPLSSSFPVVYVFTVFGLALIVHIVARLMFMTLRSAWLKRKADPNDKKKAPATAITNEMRAGLDRSAGTLIGAVMTAAVLWLGLSMLVLADRPLELHGVELGVKNADYVRLSTQYNAVAIIFGPEIHRLDLALQRMQAKKKVPPTLQADSRWNSLAHDDSLVRALNSGDLRALKRSPVLSLLTDPNEINRAIAASSGQ